MLCRGARGGDRDIPPAQGLCGGILVFRQIGSHASQSVFLGRVRRSKATAMPRVLADTIDGGMRHRAGWWSNLRRSPR